MTPWQTSAIEWNILNILGRGQPLIVSAKVLHSKQFYFLLDLHVMKLLRWSFSGRAFPPRGECRVFDP